MFTTEKKNDSKHYAVIGNPVAHSKSPLIHRLFAEQTGVDLEYAAIEVEPDRLESFVSDFFDDGGSGLNVTVPFKERAFGLARVLSSRATLARAVNTLQMQEGQLAGDNTDGAGLVRDLRANHGFRLEGARVLLLGAGGAVRGVLGPLSAEKPASVTILNRTVARAEQLKADFAATLALDVMDYASINREKGFDLVINGTSLGLSGQIPPLSQEMMAADCCCYDMMYADRDTAFVTWAKKHGVGLAVDGLGMLVEQAAEAFHLWHGTRPETAPVIATIRGGR